MSRSRGKDLHRFPHHSIFWGVLKALRGHIQVIVKVDILALQSSELKMFLWKLLLDPSKAYDSNLVLIHITIR